jgi:hypothetical protein
MMKNDVIEFYAFYLNHVQTVLLALENRMSEIGVEIDDIVNRGSTVSESERLSKLLKEEFQLEGRTHALKEMCFAMAGWYANYKRKETSNLQEMESPSKMMN